MNGVVRELLGGADPRDLTHPQVALVRALLEDPDRGGLWLFARLVCGLTKLTDHLHWDMCMFLSQWGKPGWERLMLMVPRGTFKTSIGSKALPLWIATKDPEVTFGIFNAAQDQAKSWIASMRQILERSRLYHTLWPERLPPGVHWRDREAGRSTPKSWKWGDAGLQLVRDSHAVSEPTFEPYGIGGSSTGRHYTHRVMDDLIGETAAQSPVIIEDAIHFVEHARNLEKPVNGGCELVNCTPWAYRDCYSFMLSHWPKDYRVYRRSLLEHPKTGEPDVVDGESIFPEQITTDQAKEMWERNPYTFASQQQCIPMSGRDIAFDQSWIHVFALEKQGSEWVIEIHPDDFDPTRVVTAVAEERAPNRVPLHWCDRAVLIDPAPSKKGEKSQEPRARNGLIAIALDPWGRIFTLESEGLREDPVMVMETCVLMCRRWGIRKVGIESVNFSQVYGPLWSALIKHRHPDMALAFQELMTKGEDKDLRIRSIIAPHREGLWYYNEPRCASVLQELIEYPNGETRDLLDAQAYVRQALSRPATPSEREMAYLGSRVGRDPWTNY